MNQRPTMTPKQGDRAVLFESEYGDKARVRAWTNSGVLTIEVTFDEEAAVEVEVNDRTVRIDR